MNTSIVRSFTFANVCNNFVNFRLCSLTYICLNITIFLLYPFNIIGTLGETNKQKGKLYMY